METKNPSLTTADELFNEAKELLNRPEEDIVPYAVCQKAYEAIMAYLKGFLQENHVNIDRKMEAQELLDYCRRIDDSFKELDLSVLKDPKATEDVWMNLDWAKDFIDMTEKTRKLAIPTSN